MKTILRKRYSSDFKAQVIDLFNLGKTVPQLAEEFGVGTSILYRKEIGFWLGRDRRAKGRLADRARGGSNPRR